VERVLRETDRTQRLIDVLVINRGQSDLEAEQKAFAVQVINQLGSAMKG
jgi:hypothetical protein